MVGVGDDDDSDDDDIFGDKHSDRLVLLITNARNTQFFCYNLSHFLNETVPIYSCAIFPAKRHIPFGFKLTFHTMKH